MAATLAGAATPEQSDPILCITRQGAPRHVVVRPHLRDAIKHLRALQDALLSRDHSAVSVSIRQLEAVLGEMAWWIRSADRGSRRLARLAQQHPAASRGSMPALIAMYLGDGK